MVIFSSRTEYRRFHLLWHNFSWWQKKNPRSYSMYTNQTCPYSHNKWMSISIITFWHVLHFLKFSLTFLAIKVIWKGDADPPPNWPFNFPRFICRERKNFSECILLLLLLLFSCRGNENFNLPLVFCDRSSLTNIASHLQHLQHKSK